MKEFVKRLLPERLLQEIYFIRKYGFRAMADKALHGVDPDSPGDPKGRRILYEKFLTERAKLHREQQSPGNTDRERRDAQDKGVCFIIMLGPGLYPAYQKADLRATIDSLQSQTYGNWRLVLEGSEEENTGSGAALKRSGARGDDLLSLLEREQDERVRSGLLSCKDGRQEDSAGVCYRMAVRCGDTFSADMLARLEQVICADGFPDIVYMDQDCYDRITGRFSDPCLKPDFAPEYLESDDYISEACLFSDAVLIRAGGWYADQGRFSEREDKDAYVNRRVLCYDRVLRCMEHTEQIVHVPDILFHRGIADEKYLGVKEGRMRRKLQKQQQAKAGFSGDRKGKARNNTEGMCQKSSAEAKKEVLEAHFTRIGRNVKVTADAQHDVCHSRYLLREQPLVSILIPNKDHVEDLRRCLRSLDTLSYPNYEVIVIENNSRNPETFAFYEQLSERERVQIVFWQEAFHFPAINNFGASYARGAYLLFLNNDTQVISTDLLEQMLGHFEKDAVGIVGARLLYGDDTVQHAGIVVGESGVADPLFVGAGREDACYQKRAVCAQDYSAVTAACMLVSRAVFDAVGGMSEYLPVAYNDVDFCMKVRALGKRIVYEPCAQMYHFESKSRGYENTPKKQARMEKERDAFAAQWKEALAKPDPYFHPLLSVGPEPGRLDIHSL